MIDVTEQLDDALLTESARARHLYEDPSLTFADIRDALTKVFSGEIEMQEVTDGIRVLVTYRDGRFMAAVGKATVKDPVDYSKAGSCLEDPPEGLGDAIKASLKDLAEALSRLDDVQLNRFFANGRNFLECEVICPACANVLDYGGRCLVALRALRCYNDKFAEVGEDKESAKELFGILNSAPSLGRDRFELAEPAKLRLKGVVASKEALKNVMDRLQKFIDGVGWKCSIDQYVCDQYSRRIVNKALEHGIDVSRQSDFVTALARRLSQVSDQKPTKSDLVTYAKCDGIDTRSDAYREFLADLESTADETNEEIVSPVEDLIAYAGMALMKNLVGFMSADPSKTAKKFLADLTDSVQLMDDGRLDLSPEKVARFKKNLAKVEQYHEGLPAEGVLFTYKGRPYRLTGDFGPAAAILGVIKYR